MFLRATRIEAPPDNIGAAIDNFETNIVKGLRAAPGNQGAVLLVDRQSGSALGVTYWESARALAASEQTGTQSRTQAVKNVPGGRS
jgi:quinol monooxygenase YgiN